MENILKEYEEMKKKLEDISKEKEDLEKLNKELEITAKKYTNPRARKEYYYRNREKLIEKSKEYNKTHIRPQISKDKQREYNRRYYLKRKQKKIEDSN